jgi:hypothetical protein
VIVTQDATSPNTAAPEGKLSQEPETPGEDEMTPDSTPADKRKEGNSSEDKMQPGSNEKGMEPSESVSMKPEV